MKTLTATTKNQALAIGKFLTSPYAFDQTWAPAEKNFVKKAPLESLKTPNHRYWYMQKNGQVVAAMGVRENKYGSGGFEIDQDYMAVHRNYRRLGLATQLLQELENFTKIRNGRYIHILSCDIDTYTPARCFYQKHGYKQICHTPDYYVLGEGRIDFFKRLAQ